MLMWCVSPRSYLHSIWRALDFGFADPFSISTTRCGSGDAPSCRQYASGNSWMIWCSPRTSRSGRIFRVLAESHSHSKTTSSFWRYRSEWVALGKGDASLIIVRRRRRYEQNLAKANRQGTKPTKLRFDSQACALQAFGRRRGHRSGAGESYDISIRGVCFAPEGELNLMRSYLSDFH